MQNASQIIARMNAARERIVPLTEKLSVTLRRPTDLERLTYAGVGGIARDKLFNHVVDWKGFTEADLVPSGATDEVPFDAAVWALWIADHPQHWDAVITALVEMIEARATEPDRAAKN
jgi:hypothetical protein